MQQRPYTNLRKLYAGQQMRMRRTAHVYGTERRRRRRRRKQWMAQNHAISPDFIQPQNLVFEMRGILAEYFKKEEIFHPKHYIIHLREVTLKKFDL